MGTGYPHDQNRHLLIPPGQGTPPAVIQRGERHGACIDNAYRILKGCKPFFFRPDIRNKDGFVLSGKRILEAVLQDAARAHDDGFLAVVVQKMQKLMPDLRPEGACQNRSLQFPGKLEVPFLRTLPDGEIPQPVLHQIAGVDIRSDVEGIVCFHIVIQLRPQVFQDLARGQHPA